MPSIVQVAAKGVWSFKAAFEGVQGGSHRVKCIAFGKMYRIWKENEDQL